jgi:hypothetical protein
MPEVPESLREILHAYLAQAQNLFGEVLDAVILYGSAAGGEYLTERSNINLLMLLTRQDTQLLTAYAALHKRWRNEQIVVPLFLTRSELHASRDFFPLEYLEIQEQHIVLSGRDPFLDLRLDPTLVRLQCKRDLHGNLVRLRQRFVEGGASPEAITILLPLSFTALLPCLRGLLWAAGKLVDRTSEGTLRAIQKELGVELAAFEEVLKLKRGLISPGPAEAPRLFERYAAALHSLIERAERLSA